MGDSSAVSSRPSLGNITAWLAFPVASTISRAMTRIAHLPPPVEVGELVALEYAQYLPRIERRRDGPDLPDHALVRAADSPAGRRALSRARSRSHVDASTLRRFRPSHLGLRRGPTGVAIPRATGASVGAMSAAGGAKSEPLRAPFNGATRLFKPKTARVRTFPFWVRRARLLP